MKENLSARLFDSSTVLAFRVCASVLVLSGLCGLAPQAFGQVPRPASSVPAPATVRPAVPASVIPPAVTPLESSAAATSDEGTRMMKQTFRQLGAVAPLTLRGADSRDGVRFNVRADEVVLKAALTLSYGFSPALINDGSQLNVLINGDVAA